VHPAAAPPPASLARRAGWPPGLCCFEKKPAPEDAGKKVRHLITRTEKEVIALMVH